MKCRLEPDNSARRYSLTFEKSSFFHDWGYLLPGGDGALPRESARASPPGKVDQAIFRKIEGANQDNNRVCASDSAGWADGNGMVRQAGVVAPVEACFGGRGDA